MAWSFATDVGHRGGQLILIIAEDETVLRKLHACITLEIFVAVIAIICSSFVSSSFKWQDLITI